MLTQYSLVDVVKIGNSCLRDPLSHLFTICWEFCFFFCFFYFSFYLRNVVRQPKCKYGICKIQIYWQRAPEHHLCVQQPLS